MISEIGNPGRVTLERISNKHSDRSTDGAGRIYSILLQAHQVGRTMTATVAFGDRLERRLTCCNVFDHQADGLRRRAGLTGRGEAVSGGAVFVDQEIGSVREVDPDGHGGAAHRRAVRVQDADGRSDLVAGSV